MIKQIFQCEKCKQEWDTSDPKYPGVVNVACRVNYGYDYSSFSNTYAHDELSMNWCRNCIDQLRLYEVKKQKPLKPTSPPVPTVEETLIGLLETLGFSREH